MRTGARLARAGQGQGNFGQGKGEGRGKGSGKCRGSSRGRGRLYPGVLRGAYNVRAGYYCAGVRGRTARGVRASCAGRTGVLRGALRKRVHVCMGWHAPQFLPEAGGLAIMWSLRSCTMTMTVRATTEATIRVATRGSSTVPNTVAITGTSRI